MKGRRRITESLVLLSFVLVGVLLLSTLVPGGESKAKLSEILLTRPVFAQQATAFPADEAGISAYVNVGQSIDLEKAKSALRGIQAEGDNYVIGIMELTGLPEEEFPHIYVSSAGWILAYYSKFAPASRVMDWSKYSGGAIITTTTLESAMSKMGASIGIDNQQVKDRIKYYDFRYPDATYITIAADTTEGQNDNFSYSIPSGVILYEASFSHIARPSGNPTYLKGPDGETISQVAGSLNCGRLDDRYLTPDKAQEMQLHIRWADWMGVAVVFIYR